MRSRRFRVVNRCLFIRLTHQIRRLQPLEHIGNLIGLRSDALRTRRDEVARLGARNIGKWPLVARAGFGAEIFHELPPASFNLSSIICMHNVLPNS